MAIDDLSKADTCVVCGGKADSMHCESKTCTRVKHGDCKIADVGKKVER